MRLALGLLTAALLLPASALSAPRPLNCHGKMAKKFLSQALKGQRFSGWGSATPKRGVSLKLNSKADQRKGGMGITQRRDGWNTLHVLRYHAAYGANVSVSFRSKVTTDTLVQMCTWEVPYKGAPKLVGSPKATLSYARGHKFANVRAPATRDTHRKDRVSLVWISPSSSVAAGQRYGLTVGPCKRCKARGMSSR